MSYHKFRDHAGEEYGSFEVFYSEGRPHSLDMPQGWYWWACFPGCMPDGEANGPFKTEQDAINDAQEKNA